MLNFLMQMREVGSFSHSGFRVVFIKCPVTRVRGDIIHLREALAQNLVEVSEVSSAGTVNSLKVVNKSDKFVVMFRGDALVGGKQNRTLYTTLILAPRSENIIPVACVEAGRWRWKTEKMEQHLRIPRLMHLNEMMIEGYFPSRSAMTRDTVKTLIQRLTWSEISHRERELSQRSETSDVVEIVSKEVRHGLNIEVPDEANGVIYVYDDKMIGGEIFLIPIDKSYIRDAVKAAYFDYKYCKKIGEKMKSGISTIEELVEEIKECELEDKGSILEENVKLLKSKRLMGFIVQLNNTPVYVEFSALMKDVPLRSFALALRDHRFLRDSET